jgi:TPR repeat protein
MKHLAVFVFLLISFFASGVEQKSFSQYLRLAQRGNPEAQNRVGVAYYKGDGVRKDYREAFNWFLKSARNGHARAAYNLGWCYLNNEGGSRAENLKKAVYWFRKSAEKGDASGQNALGACYSLGQGVEKNDQKAFYWIKKICRAGACCCSIQSR